MEDAHALAVECLLLVAQQVGPLLRPVVGELGRCNSASIKCSRFAGDWSSRNARLVGSRGEAEGIEIRSTQEHASLGAAGDGVEPQRL